MKIDVLFSVKYIGESDPVCLMNGKVYNVVSVENGDYRVIDEEGEDYLYPPDLFEVIGEAHK